MGLCYADRSGPSTSLSVGDAVPHGHGARGRRGSTRKVTAGHGANTTAMDHVSRISVVEVMVSQSQLTFGSRGRLLESWAIAKRS
jgi:hypothetical protein